MANEDVIEVEEAEEPEEEEEEEPGDEFTIDGELKAIGEEVAQQQKRLKKMALRMDQQSQEEGAIAIREVIGVYATLSEVIGATANALSELDDQIDAPPPDTFLLDDDAKELYVLMAANLKVITEARDSALTDDAREKLGVLATLNEKMMERIVEMSDMEESELQAATEG